MKSYLLDFEMTSPTSLNEALDLRASSKCIPFAGGTDLMVQVEKGIIKRGHFLDLSKIPEFKGISHGSVSKIGSLVTYGEIKANKAINDNYPILVDASREVGSIAIGERGTIGGNIANASPAADFVPALYLYDCKVNVVSKDSSRSINLDQFYFDYKKFDLKPDELIASIEVSSPSEGYKYYYRKVGTRKIMAISKVLLAAKVKLDGECITDVKLAFASVGPTTLFAKKTEGYLIGKNILNIDFNELELELNKEITPMADIRSNERYRRKVSFNLLKEFLEQNQS